MRAVPAIPRLSASSGADIRQIGSTAKQGADRQTRIAAGEAAEVRRRAVNFEGAVGAAIPVSKTLREGLGGPTSTESYGTSNGT